MKCKTPFRQNVREPPQTGVIHLVHVNVLVDGIAFQLASNDVFALENIHAVNEDYRGLSGEVEQPIRSALWGRKSDLGRVLVTNRCQAHQGETQPEHRDHQQGVIGGKGEAGAACRRAAE